MNIQNWSIATPRRTGRDYTRYAQNLAQRGRRATEAGSPHGDDGRRTWHRCTVHAARRRLERFLKISYGRNLARCSWQILHAHAAHLSSAIKRQLIPTQAGVGSLCCARYCAGAAAQSPRGPPPRRMMRSSLIFLYERLMCYQHTRTRRPVFFCSHLALRSPQPSTMLPSRENRAAPFLEGGLGGSETESLGCGVCAPKKSEVNI